MTRKPAGFTAMYPGGLATYATLAEAVTRAKVGAHTGKPMVVYELVEVYRVEPTNEPTVEPPRVG